ncbi:copper amine oxidase N-terminal domain-containing protein [Symbiobacterium thermophilum]|uniref:Copper amine oxidase-like N-terminal domain-containing protein n=1 Tax=Symbiobacterium thermophilum TaxID=2734 RepID=A0A953I7S8_SYMTR|nr:copper amine oxidase N-terminal domain-containing protein [Symbiobacterium thermophilum]MBY6275534.1 hypothetical protein [Symbiobacterium thermophilum]
MRRFFVVLLMLILIPTAVPGTALAEEPVRLFVNGSQVVPDVAPVIVSDRTLVPVRFLAEPLGFAVEWDGATGTVTLSGARVIRLAVGRPEAIVDGTVVALDVAPVNVDGRVMVPLRFVAEQMGAAVEWDPQNRVVTVTAARILPEGQVGGDLALLGDVGALAWLVQGHTTGEWNASVAMGALTTSYTFALDGYREGDDLLIRLTAAGPGQKDASGLAVRGGKVWRLGADGGWTLRPEEAPPLAFAGLNGKGINLSAEGGLLDPEITEFAGAPVVREERTVDGVTYQVTTVTLDAQTIADLLPEFPRTGAEASLRLTVYCLPDSQQPVRTEMRLEASPADGLQILVDGTLVVEPLGGPIPFPPEVLSQ